MDRATKEFCESKDSTNFQFSDPTKICDENEGAHLDISSENQYPEDIAEETQETQQTVVDFIHKPESGSEQNNRGEGLHGSKPRTTQKRVRFSENVEECVDHVFHNAIAHPEIPMDESSSVSVLNSAVLPHLQNLLQSVAEQQAMVLELIHNMGGGDPQIAANNFGLMSERESQHQLQTDELQEKVTSLMNELRLVKAKNAELEHQFNAAKIRKEEAEER